MCRFVWLLFISINSLASFAQKGVFVNLKSGMGLNENFTEIENNHRLIYFVNDFSAGCQFKLENHPKLFWGIGVGTKYSFTSSETSTEEVSINSTRIYGALYGGLVIKNHFQINIATCLQNNRNVDDFVTGQAFNYRSNLSVGLDRIFKQKLLIGFGYRRALIPFHNPYFLKDPANLLFLNFKLILNSETIAS